jgi:LPXTG-motif cell wall-anchored protein
MDQPSGRRHALAGLASIAAGIVITIGALPGNAGAAAQQATPSTSIVPGNPTCGDLAPEGASWTELKVEPVVDGTFTDGTLTVTLDVSDTADGPVFSWTSNIGVDAVFVKGGPIGGTLYLYDPPAESTGDTGLHSPVNPMNGKFSGLSHVSFCYDKEQATTTTTEQETTTTTTSESTTTTVGGSTTTTTVGGSTTTTAGGVSPTTVTPGGELPRTGSTTGPTVGIGAALLVGGALLVGYARRFRAS